MGCGEDGVPCWGIGSLLVGSLTCLVAVRYCCSNRVGVTVMADLELTGIHMSPLVYISED